MKDDDNPVFREGEWTPTRSEASPGRTNCQCWSTGDVWCDDCAPNVEGAVEREVAPGFPVCSYEHSPANMQLVSWFASGDNTQDETWSCPTCGSQLRCDLPARAIPEALREVAEPIASPAPER